MATLEWEVLDTSGVEWEVVDGGQSWLVQTGPVEITGGGGSFDGVHNDLSGRSTADAHPASAVSVDASGFDGNLGTGDDTVQKVAQKLDDLVVDGGGPDLSDAAPQDLGTASAGVAETASRADHVHDMPTAADVGAAASSHTHDASAITTGTVATARLGSSTASSTTYLRGDQTWSKIARPILSASKRHAAGFGTPITPLINQAATTTIAKGVLYGLLCNNRPETISELMIQVTSTSLSAGQVVIVGAAAIDGGLPGSLLWSEPITVGTTTGVISKTGLSVALPEWCYVVVLNPNGNAGSVTLRGGGPALSGLPIATGFGVTANNVALATPYTAADTMPSSFSDYTIQSGVSSTSERWGASDTFPLIAAVA